MRISWLSFKQILTRENIILTMIVVVFFVISSWFVWSLWIPNNQATKQPSNQAPEQPSDLTTEQPSNQAPRQIIHNWPDAMANQYFIDNFAKTGELTIPTPLNAIADNVIHPRSVNIVNHALVPMSFTGMIVLYGILAKILGSVGILWVTPLISSLALLLWYSLMVRLFSDKRMALVTTALLAFFAPWLYFTTLSMLHTTLALSLVMLGWWLITMPARKNPWFRHVMYLLAGIAFGLSLWVRPVEAPWIVGSLIVFAIFFRSIITKEHVFGVICGMFLGLLPMFAVNSAVYGHWYSLGYLNFDVNGGLLDQLPSEFKVSVGNKVIGFIQSVLIPFGLHPRMLLLNFWTYFIVFFAPWLVGSVAGVVVYWKQKRWNPAISAYIVSALCSVVWLLGYYGNWVFADWDTLKYNLIGSSYMRYFLPAFIMLLPGVTYALFSLYGIVRPKVAKALIILFVVLLTGVSGIWTYGSTYDGLFAVKQNMEGYYEDYRAVQSLVPANAILIVDRADKIFFPKYDVVVFQFNYKIFSSLAKIIAERPMFYYTSMTDEDIRMINDTKINETGIRLVEFGRVNDAFRIFKLEKSPYED